VRILSNNRALKRSPNNRGDGLTVALIKPAAYLASCSIWVKITCCRHLSNFDSTTSNLLMFSLCNCILCLQGSTPHPEQSTVAATAYASGSGVAGTAATKMAVSDDAWTLSPVINLVILVAVSPSRRYGDGVRRFVVLGSRQPRETRYRENEIEVVARSACRTRLCIQCNYSG
jgi:hypothetical protein